MSNNMAPLGTTTKQAKAGKRRARKSLAASGPKSRTSVTSSSSLGPFAKVCIVICPRRLGILFPLKQL